MIGRLALRSLTAHPVRSAVLAAGFGFGVGGDGHPARRRRRSCSSRRSRRQLVGGGDVRHPRAAASAGAAAAARARCSPMQLRARVARGGAVAHDRACICARRQDASASTRAAAFRAWSGRSAIRRSRRRGVARHRRRPRVDARLAGPRAARRSIASIAFPMRRSGATRGPSGSTSTAAHGDARFYLTFMVGRARRTAGASPACGCSSIATDSIENFAPERHVRRRGRAARAGPDDRRQPRAPRRSALPHPPRSAAARWPRARAAIWRSKVRPAGWCRRSRSAARAAGAPATSCP